MSMSIADKMWNYPGQNVIIEDNEGKRYEGRLIDCEKPDDNEEGEYAIYLTTITGENWCLLEHEIVSLEIKE